MPVNKIRVAAVFAAIMSVFSLAGCAREATAATVPGRGEFRPQVSEWDVLAAVDQRVLAALANGNRTDADGAMGRNREGYFSAVFQRNTTPLIIYAVIKKDAAILDEGIRSWEYAFSHMNQDGSFVFSPPSAFQDKRATAGDLASAEAFFLSDFGHGLALLDESAWMRTIMDAPLSTRINRLKIQGALALRWLSSQKKILSDYDRKNTNRLFFDAMAFFFLGKSLSDAAAVRDGGEFASMALSAQTIDGCFPENEGFDSSYQAVSLFNALGYYETVRRTGR
ncbi:MAG: hypothetical protein EHM28_02440 [Spirochaetaceae bacterium]|nr:MAG: hypothetical protein EHM28_02440 [Spirochaetaceae bacterium]